MIKQYPNYGSIELTDSTDPGQSGAGRNGNEEVLHIPQSSEARS